MYYPFLGKLYFVCGLITLILMLTTFFRKKRSALHFEFTIILGTITLSFLSKCSLFFTKSAIAWLFAERIIVAANIFCCATIVLMVYSYLEKKIGAKLIVLLYSSALFLSILAFTPYGIKEVLSLSPMKRINGPFLYFVKIIVQTYILYAGYLIASNYFKLKGQKRLQLKYFVIGLFTLMVAGTITFTILPSSQNNITITAFAVILSLLPLVIISYSLSPELVSTDFMLFNVIKYSLLLTVLISCEHIFFHILHMHHTISLVMAIGVSGILYFTFYRDNEISLLIESFVLKKRIQYHQLLNETSKAVITILDIDKLCDYVIHSIRKALGAEKIAIFFIEHLQDKTMLKMQCSSGLDHIKTNYIFNQKFINLLETNKQPLIMDTAFQLLPKQEYSDIINELGNYGAILVLPLISKNKLIGIMTVDQKKSDGAIFDIQDIEILETLANNLGTAISNAKLYKELDDTYIRITRALSLVLETKDTYTVGHSDNVTKYALVISKKLNLPELEIVKIAQAAMLHDLGKIGIHDYILEKPTKLTPAEWEEVKLHTVKGAKILESLPFLKEVSEIVKHHHEHYNGTGYPSHIKSKEIPLGSQILGVADAFDAMTTERPYKNRKLNINQAINELIKHSGTQFNPEIVKIFIETIKENPNIVLAKKIMENEPLGKEDKYDGTTN